MKELIKFIKKTAVLTNAEIKQLENDYNEIKFLHEKIHSKTDEFLNLRRNDLDLFFKNLIATCDFFTNFIFDKKKLEFSGVYMICAYANNEFILGYIGESKNIYKRWIYHSKKINTKNSSSQRVHKQLNKLLRENKITTNDIYFIKIAEINNLRERIFHETELILKTKSIKLMANNKNILRLKLCPICDGVLNAKIDVIFKNNRLYNIYIIKCKNKQCMYEHIF
ncbi:hypothetical protein [Spiroplasma endosymbiont of Labia minor]|uniref:hypothetical protein n=1 Tax=Spiroplasma endosymbiont of Labia minor TaxID=3066305 RepID=UPI0030CDFAFF